MKSIYLAVILFIVSLLASFVLLQPKVKAWTQNILLDTDRKILSQMITDYGVLKVKILKVKEFKGLSLEIYSIKDQNHELIDKKDLTDKKDAFYTFEKKKLNLFLKDINEDGVPEILVPTIDKNMVAHMNVFSFSEITRKLEKISNH